MCGIFGYIGKESSLSTLIDGLWRLEYRGYDSCGLAAIKDNKFFFRKRAGKIRQLREELNEHLKETFPLCILHTRWATHGRPTQANAHPHSDCKGTIAVVHNGIIENYLTLKEQLIREGCVFKSETDTEVIAHLIERFYKSSLEEAVFKAIQKLEGSFALGVVSRDEPHKLIGIKKASPLIVGCGKDSNLLASDILAITPFTKEVIYLKDEEVAVLGMTSREIFNFRKERVRTHIERVTIKAEDGQKKGFERFMLKEIFEQPECLKRLYSTYVRERVVFGELNLKDAYIKNIKNIFITACGTAYHAGYVGKYILEKYCDVDVEIDTSSEFRYRSLNLKRNDLIIAISQSGETADTLAAVREARAKGARVLSICNVLGSSLVKESDGLIYTLAGPEIGVASTKAYTAQLFCFYLLSLYLAHLRKTLPEPQIKQILKELGQIPLCLKEILDKATEIQKIAKDFSKFGCFLFLGRGINYPSALEGALKLKEISYIPAEGYPAGEMKHGPIALIDEYRAVVCIAPQDNLYEKMTSNIQETKARKGRVLGVVNYGDKEASLLSDEVIYIPQLINQDLSPLVVAVPLQLFAYFVAKNLGCDIDQPRNLAKSVTVE